jgi:hypothetical protein
MCIQRVTGIIGDQSSFHKWNLPTKATPQYLFMSRVSYVVKCLALTYANSVTSTSVFCNIQIFCFGERLRTQFSCIQYAVPLNVRQILILYHTSFLVAKRSKCIATISDLIIAVQLNSIPDSLDLNKYYVHDESPRAELPCISPVGLYVVFKNSI